jgi:ATP/maltotriose-dependent transcriptional regulator MalT
VARRTAAAIDLTVSTGDLAAVEVLAQNISPLLAPGEGFLDRVEAYTAWADRRFPDGPTLVRLGVLRHRATTTFLRGRLDEALAAADAAAVEFAEPLRSLPFAKSTIDWVRAGTHFARGDLAAAEAAGRPDDADSDIGRDMDVLRIAFLARVWRAQGRAADIAGLLPAVDAASRSRYGDLTAWVAASVRADGARAAGDLDVAQHHLGQAEEIQSRVRHVPFLGSARLDRALVLDEAGDRSAAIRTVADVLAEARAAGMPGILLAAGREAIPLLVAARDAAVHADTAALVLGILGEKPAPAPLPVPGTPEVLSAREVEVLRLLAAGASNQDIADALFVSRNTVKTHVQRVLTKLGAGSRGQAVATARSLHLV